LVLRWSNEQVEPLVDELAPLLPDNLTHQMLLAAAGIARSVVTEKKSPAVGCIMPGRKTRIADRSGTATGIPFSLGTT
jgi:hypothetical protein